MSLYEPDKWLIVKVHDSVSNSSVFKILSTWYGSYGKGDEWRFSSGITNVEEKEFYYEVTNHSGSVYYCYKNSEGASAYAASVLSDFISQAEKTDNITIERSTIEEVTYE